MVRESPGPKPSPVTERPHPAVTVVAGEALAKLAPQKMISQPADEGALAVREGEDEPARCKADRTDSPAARGAAPRPLAVRRDVLGRKLDGRRVRGGRRPATGRLLPRQGPVRLHDRPAGRPRAGAVARAGGGRA